MRFCRFLLILAFLCAFMSDAQALDEGLRPAPEAATGLNTVQSAVGTKMMAVTAHPLATQAAYTALKSGGNAMDAAIAAQAVLGLVEPQSSGLGGGGFMLYYDAGAKSVFTYDGRETAPDTAGPYLFIDKDGKPMKFYDAAVGGRAVGVPGLVRMMELSHERHGLMAWNELFKPAISYAQNGFAVTPRLSKMLAKSAMRFDVDTKTKLNFFPDTKTPLQAGDIYKNIDYARTLNMIAGQGAESFYLEQNAIDIAEKVRGAKSNPGGLTVEDMRGYKAKSRPALCDTYRGYQICSIPEPSSGGLTLLQILKIVEYFDLRALGAESAKSWHVIAEASRLAFADRNKYIGDADFIGGTRAGLLDPDYIRARAGLINPDKAQLEVSAGAPPFMDDIASGVDDAIKPPGTTHISIVDQWGNMVSMTSSIESAFGSHLMVNGYLLNNQLTDFAFEPFDESGAPKANKVEGGKRPRSSMAPVFIFTPEGKPFMVIGSAGGSRIIGFVAAQIIRAIDWGVPLNQAITRPHILHRGRKLEIEKIDYSLAEPLKNHGHAITVGDMNSGITGIEFTGDQLIGTPDPRREGVAMGE